MVTLVNLSRNRPVITIISKKSVSFFSAYVTGILGMRRKGGALSKRSDNY